jgi:predicted TIM-barrel fold metal-dependent hydrolase
MGVIDSDAHVVECRETFRYIDAKDKAYKPLVVAQEADDDDPRLLSNAGTAQKHFWIIDGKLQPMEGNIGSDTTAESREMRSIDARLKHMDELNIDVQVLYPTVFLRAWTQDPTCELVICRSYNRWLADIWKKAKTRLRWVVMPPLLNMQETRKELEFGKANGAVGIFLRGLECERRLTNPYFYPLYEMAQELDMPLCFHSGNNSFNVRNIYATESGFGRSKLPVVAAFHSLVMDNIPAKFPKARWGFVEVSAEWLPYVINDLDLRFKRKGKRLSKTLLKDNKMFVAVQTTDNLKLIVDTVGEENLVVGTDYGHSDTSSEILALRRIRDDGKLQAPAVNRILDDNARALYGL